MKQLFLFFLAALTVSAAWPGYAYEDRIDFSADGDFSESAIRRGVKATREQCEKVDNAVWASTKDHGEECLKYWAAGFSGKTEGRAIVYFHGDVWTGAGRTSKEYLQMTNRKLQRDAQEWSKKLLTPYIFLLDRARMALPETTCRGGEWPNQY